MATRVTIVGTAGEDSITAATAAELIFAGAGADAVDAGAGDDEVWGADGNDTLRGGTGADLLYGGAGDDRLEGGAGRNDLDGGDGNDTLVAGNDGDDLDGGAGDNSLEGGDGDDDIEADDGNNVIRAGKGDDDIDVGDGDNDIQAGDGDDEIDVGDGRNRVDAGAGDDEASGGEGSDTLLGGEGKDTLEGGGGGDHLDGGEGDDDLDGGEGNDLLVGGEGHNALEGDDGDDSITAGAGDDTIAGDDGDDTVAAGDGDNRIDGGDGDDRITAGAGNDVIDGDDGDDLIVAGEGDDLVRGGSGADTLTGGTGRDVFAVQFEARPLDALGVASGALVVDVVTDFRAGPGGDRLDLAAIGGSILESGAGASEQGRWSSYFNNAEDADTERAYAADLFKQGVARFVQDGQDTVLQLDTSVTGGEGGWRVLLRLSGVNVAELTPDNIVQPAGGPAYDVLGTDGRQGTDAGENLTAVASGETIYAKGGNDALAGGGAADILIGGEGDDSVSGGAGSDVARGDAGNDTLAGGTGKDLLVGGEGNDTYLFNLGDGVDMVADSGGADDVLLLGPGIARAQVEVIQSGDGDLVLVVATTPTHTDRVVLENGGGIERVRFANGDELTRTQLLDLARAGGPGYDRIVGTNGADILRGGYGDDLHGLGGADTYRFERGDGEVTVDDLGPADEVDTVQFGARIRTSDITVIQDGYQGDLVLQVGGPYGSDRVVLSRRLQDPAGGADRVVFADGTVWTIEDIIDRSLSGTDGMDTLEGDARDNTLRGGRGVYDSLDGRLGSDTYLYAVGDGRDSIVDRDDLDGGDVKRPGNTDVDTLQLAAGIRMENVRVTGGWRDEFRITVGPEGNGDHVDIAGVDRVVFADGGVWTVADLRRLANTPTELADDLAGTAGADLVDALAGDDRVFAGAGDDTVKGAAGADELVGGAGDDLLEGGDGDDVLRGDEGEYGEPERGNDTLLGGAGDDLIFAGAGNDRIDGGEGDDTLTIYADRNHFEVTRIGDTLTLRDLRGEGGTDTVTGVETVRFFDAVLTPAGFNDLPVLGLDEFATREQTPVTFTAAQLLANDTDANGDRLTVTAVGDAYGGTIAFDAATGLITFTPDGPSIGAAFNGLATFSYTVSDGRGGVQTRTSAITVEAVNDAPVLLDGLQRWQGVEDTPYTSPVTARVLPAVDEDDVALTYHVVADSAVGGTVALDPETRVWTFTPRPDFSGEASFSYRAFDGELYSEARTVTVTFAPVNDGPVASADAGFETDAGKPLVLTAARLLANDRDADGDALAIASVSAGTGGTVALDAAGNVVFTPAAGFSGAASFTYTVSDGQGGTAAAGVSLAVKPVAPPSAPVLVGTEGTDVLRGTDAAEVFDARGGADLVFAGGGDDRASGGEGSDALRGGNGDDALHGDGGADALFGENGDDRLHGGAGSDLLAGGAGADVFVFGGAFGRDVVLDFRAGVGAGDVLDLSALGFDSLQEVKAAAREVSVLCVPNVVIDAGAAGTITLVNVRLSALAADDVLLA